jgi:hypothetical protein
VTGDELEVIDLEEDATSRPAHLSDGPSRRPGRRILLGAVLALLVVAMLTADDLSAHRQLASRDGALQRAYRDAQRANAREEAAQAARAQGAEAARRELQAREAAKVEANTRSASRGSREIVADRRAARWCRARDLRVLDSGLDFVRFQNISGAACALLDHPVLLSPQGDGYWDPVPVFPSLENSYGDGPGWTGSFEPQYIAVLSIEYSPLNPNLGVCTTGRGSNVPYQPLALRLQPDDERLDLPGGLPASACRPIMRLWSYDTTDT